MARLRGAFALVERPETTPCSRAEMVAALTGFDGVLATLGDRFDAEVFAAAGAPRARVLANFGVGYNHIDVAAARGAGVVVTNTPGAVTEATADVAVMLMLMAARRAGEGERLVRAGAWPGWHPVQMLGQGVSGRTLGIVGMGRIGRAVARRAQAGFGMRVVFHNRSALADAGVPARQLGGLAEVMAAADIVVVTVPGGPQTRHLIDAAALAAMRPGGVLVNVSRGDVVDEAALIVALEEGRLAAAGLDVYENEPDVPARLRALENAVLLPHLGTAVEEVRVAMGMMAADNLEAVLGGGTAPNPV